MTRLPDQPALAGTGARRAGAPGGLAAEFGLTLAGGGAVTLLLAGLLADGPAVAASVALYVLGGLLAATGMQRGYPHADLGLCNAITLVRLGLISGLVPLVAVPGEVDAGGMWLAFGAAALSLALDGVDGWAARRARLASDFGARFDMEVDSLFALLLALAAWRMGQAGPWVLALGLPRYAFWGATRLWPWLAAALPPRLSRKVVCVVQIGALVAFLLPPVPRDLLTVAALVAIAGVAWSFLSDIRVLRARRP